MLTRSGVLLGILGGVVPPGSLNPDPTSDQKMSFSTPIFRPSVYNPYLFSDLEEVTKRNLVMFTKTEIMSFMHYWDKNTNKRIFLKFFFQFTYYSFSLIHMEWKLMARTFMHCCSSLKNYTQFQTKIHTDLGGTSLYGLHKGVPLPSGMLDIMRHHHIGVANGKIRDSPRRRDPS